ncbi:MAG: DegT/DnrJ/EryC1/StrS aminotransferase family protein [Caldithrix sp.]|nr:MAG: DegT/DnrJ/EryC1/StrS aminotransferase family protein [Caldithrix sp.]
MINPFYLDLTDREISDIQEKLGEILHGGNLILAKYTDEFEHEFAGYVGSKYAVSLNSCTSALEVLLTIKGAKDRRVAVPTNTNFASVAAILRAGGTPVYMDMTIDYFVPNLDILKFTVEKHPDVAGVLWVHIGGIIPPDFEKVVEFCRQKHRFLIEDCAHAHGSELNGIKAGNFADGGAFSFFPTKVMTTTEGGMITTNSEKVASRVKSFRNQGKRGGDYGGLHHDLGNSWRMSEIEAYMGLVQLVKLDEMIAVRRQAVDVLMPFLKESKIDFCEISHMGRASLYKFIIRIENEVTVGELKEKFKSRGVVLGGSVYEVPCHMQPVFKDVRFDPEDVKVATELCPKHICPPITSGTTSEDVRQIATAIGECIR